MVLPQDDTDKENPNQPSARDMASLPGWLKPDAPPASVPPARPMPDWLGASSPGPAPSPAELPSWLSAEARPVHAAPAMPVPPRSVEPAQDTKAPIEPATPQDDLSALRASMGSPGIDQMPDWLADASPASAEPPLADMPDWLAEVSPSQATEPPAPPSSSDEMPDWLSTVMQAEPASAEPPLADMPDWLAEVSPSQATEPPAPPREPTAAIPADALDWLADVPSAELASAGISDLIAQAPSAEPAEPPAQPPEPSPAAAADVPDWLADGPGTPPQSSGPAPADAPDWLSAPGAAEPPAMSAEVPDWLSTLEPAEPLAQASEPTPAEAPDWLTALEPAEPLAQSPEPTPAAPIEMPDWLSASQAAESLPQLPEAPAQPAETARPSISSDAKDWLSGLTPLEPAAASAQTPEAETMSQQQTADWLSSLEQPSSRTSESIDPLLAEPVAGPTSPADQAADDLFDWLNVDMDLPVDTATPSGSGEDLLGLTSDLTSPASEEIGIESETAEESSTEPDTLPDWWQSVQPAAEAPWGDSSGTSSDLLDQISGLRFDAIVGSGSQASATEPEKVGALKDVVGVIQPEVVFEGGSLAAGGLGVESVITDDQNRRIERLQKLLEAEEKEILISAERRRAVPFVRWLAVASLIAAIAGPVIMGVTILPAPQTSSNAADADKLLSALPEESTILVAFEYEPDAAAELQPLATTLLKRIGSRTDVTIYAISTKPTGPAMADDAFNKAFPSETGPLPNVGTEGSGLATPGPATETEGPAPDRSGWVNLGYLPGGANGISELVLGSPHGLPSRLVFDYQGQPTGITQASLRERPPALMFIVTTRAEDLRPWIEQAGQVMNTPILVAASAGSAPLALPYKRSGQVGAVLIGVGDTLSYQALAGGSPDQALVTTWNAQALGGLSAALVIIMGGLFYGFTSWRKQQEQGR